MRGSLAVAAGARLSLRSGARLRGLEATTRLPRRICRGSRVARALGRPEDGRPARKSESAPNLGGLQSWADEPAAAEAPRSSARWDDDWEDTLTERRASASRGSRPDFDLDDNGEPVDRAGTSGDAEWDNRRRGVRDGVGDEHDENRRDWDPYAYREAYSRRDAYGSFGKSLPGAAGAAVSWLLKAAALVSDATASNVAFLFPRAVPRATLRALAYGAWAVLFFAVFQKLLSTIVLVGGAALLAVAVASGELGARGGSETARRNFETRRGARPSRGAWGSRGESFDAFVDGMGRRRREAFWRGATARSTRAMREFWNVGDVPGDDYAYGDVPGDDYGYADDAAADDDGSTSEASSEPFFGAARAGASAFRSRNDDVFEPGDFSSSDAQDADWSAAATEAAAAAAATAAAAVRAATEAASGASDGSRSPGDSALGASEASATESRDHRRACFCAFCTRHGGIPSSPANR